MAATPRPPPERELLASYQNSRSLSIRRRSYRLWWHVSPVWATAHSVNTLRSAVPRPPCSPTSYPACLNPYTSSLTTEFASTCRCCEPNCSIASPTVYSTYTCLSPTRSSTLRTSGSALRRLVSDRGPRSHWVTCTDVTSGWSRPEHTARRAIRWPWCSSASLKETTSSAGCETTLARSTQSPPCGVNHMYLSTRYIGVIEKLVEFLVRSSLIPNSDTPGVFLLSLKLLQ